MNNNKKDELVLKEKKILIAEDYPDHVDLILDVFETENVESEVVLMKNGQEVTGYLQEIDSSASQTTSPRQNC